jgi:hypothetical protein
MSARNQSFSRSVKIRLAQKGWLVNDLAARLPQFHRCSISHVINGKRSTPAVKTAVRKELGL